MKAWVLAALSATAWIGLSLPLQAEPVTLRFGQIPSTVRGTSSVYLHLAEQKGFFAREDIKLERIPIPGGTDKMIIALDQGAVDVTQTATPYMVQAVLRGSDAIGIASEIPRSCMACNTHATAGPFVALHTSTRASFVHGTVCCRSRHPPASETISRPSCQMLTEAPSSPKRVKFSRKSASMRSVSIARENANTGRAGKCSQRAIQFATCPAEPTAQPMTTEQMEGRSSALHGMSSPLTRPVWSSGDRAPCPLPSTDRAA